MRMHVFSIRTLVVIILGLFLWGCSEEQPKARLRERSSQVGALDTRLQRLEDRLDQLDREMEVQRTLQHTQINAAREDLTAIRQALALYSRDSARELSTTETAYLREARESDSTEQSSRQQSENRVLTTLLLLVFIGFIAVFAAKLWRDKEAAEQAAESPSGTGKGGDDSYVYYSKEEDRPEPPPAPDMGNKPE